MVCTVRTASGPRQEIVATPGKLPGLDHNARRGWEETADLLDDRCCSPGQGRFGWLTPRVAVWREMVKQTVIVLNHNGAKITENNIKDVIGPRWAWKMAKLFPAVAFIAGDWQPKEIQDGIEEHNLEVRVRWLADGGDPARQCWWYVTELSLDHFRPSPAWIKANEELELAKECEAIMQRGLKELAKTRSKEKEKMRMIREVAELFQKARKQNGNLRADKKNKNRTELESETSLGRQWTINI